MLRFIRKTKHKMKMKSKRVILQINLDTKGQHMMLKDHSIVLHLIFWFWCVGVMLSYFNASCATSSLYFITIFLFVLLLLLLLLCYYVALLEKPVT